MRDEIETLRDENESLRANAPMHLAAEIVVGRRENADLRRQRDELLKVLEDLLPIVEGLFRPGDKPRKEILRVRDALAKAKPTPAPPED